MKLAGATAEPPHLVRARLPFVQALSLGDLDSATACFARDGCLITPDATAVHGRDRIRPLLAQLIARRTEIKVEFSNVVGGGEVVLAHERWRVCSGGPEGPRIEQTLNSTLVLRRVEAEWKLAIAAPWGWAQTYP
jgi:ketosteroid isomerase-like protein